MSSRVYGCAGCWVTVSLSPPSTIRPAYITMVSSAKYRADAMSWVM